MKFNRIIVIVMDSVGAGGAPDAAKFGDAGADTYGHIDAAVPLAVPNLRRLGLGKVAHIHDVPTDVVGAYGLMQEISAGKDTTSGHWEFMGNPVDNPFPTFPDAFPKELMDLFTAKTGYGYIGNEIASGTEIIERLGPDHFRTKQPIVYTSADSVFQIAAHNDVIPLEELYRICDITRREVCVGPYEVGRIIARPFVGEQGRFVRTGDRRDYSRLPKRKMVFEYLKEAGCCVVGVGKIGDIYAHIGLTESYHTSNNGEDMAELTKQLLAHRRDKGLLMANFVDFDSQYGHRRDVAGYAKCIEDFDAALGDFLPQLQDDELLVITADHGNDPTWRGTDHTRERVPLLLYSPAFAEAVDVGIRQTYADLGMTIMDNFGLTGLEFGTSFLNELR
ncbi:phosphopentomutase [Megasphaera stantonii]|uniref:Phosphopentomutase n=1 Tax=Megasphaera stantonii TaxID=2144175 RepID=A0A346B276_9FIRM|nr:phosphopentomutase [Megasphaera stantonii]AXL22219.1 phosphopentomutase [Megasphaera stantonii]